MDRRTILKMAAAGAAMAIGKRGAGLSRSPDRQADTIKNGQGYTYRVAFGAWINDMRNEPLPLQNWPAPQFDELTLDGLVRALEVQSEAGFNFLDVWGLFATYGYPPDIKSAFQDEERVRMARRLIKAAGKLDMQIMFGMGLLSWGYDEILAGNPGVRGVDPEGKPHAHALCGAKEESWSYVEKILDCTLDNFEFGGVHLESCDLGCCMCPECAGEDGQVGYNVRMNSRAATYIKTRWPHVTVTAIPSNWLRANAGPFSPEEEDRVTTMAGHIDCFMDQGWRGTYVAPDRRKAFISRLRCAYGTSGGIWLYHCARRNRLSYFLPYPKRTGAAIREHYEDGARGSMIYQGPMINPAVEVNTAVAGRLLQAPQRDVRDALEEVVDVYYRPHSAESRQRVAEVFLMAEDAFFDSWSEDLRNDPLRPGEFHLENLFGDSPQRTSYLEQCLTPRGRGSYRKGLVEVLQRLTSLDGQCRDDGRLGRIRTGVISAIVDIENLGYEAV
ncbi:MAG TPA: hypothetical protein PKY01_07335 [Candidatus Hydrogenedentes bacterium]|nr:hypothetical protein [Candidatus Hydrogenedentota bacterium]HQH52222.1 hypothetical protein [Candidatus Hydrogenedentota bacterium]HQM50626.1 hypothetical protein [Candidatus Hydrogenedentota bacterium]